jgi:hypothetical protein|tara:strand:- start:157 stop:468 length:312 start_codon:yes stop_codon:yes gene_type:complete
MIDFKNIINSGNPEKMDYVITVQGNPVWDYKIGALNTIFLISDLQEGIEEEYVTLTELRRYIVSSEIPFDLVKLQKEENRVNLIDFHWKDENKELCLIYDTNY